MFARLCCDAPFRNAFLQAPDQTLLGLGLDRAEQEALSSIPASDLQRYAQGLLKKRWRELAQVTPLSSRMSPGLALFYQQWLSQNPSPVEDSILGPGQHEGLRVLPFAHTNLSQPIEAPYAADLFAYEVFLSTSKTDRTNRYLASPYALHTLIEAIENHTTPLSLPASPHRYRFTHKGVQWKQ